MTALSPREAYRQALTKPAKAPRFRNKIVETEEGRFDSQKEHRRWCELKLRERAGEITELRRQVRYPLEVNGQLVCAYVADADYRESGELVVEDVKSARTRTEPAYRIKFKLMKAVHGLTIREV